jgi:D-alanyl-D-alanine carboxypeptidase/D-alanyl-D-alanine-endopeptidase (penicillin-binding protein 4)
MNSRCPARRQLWICLSLALLLAASEALGADALDRLIGAQDAAMLVGPDGRTLYARHADRSLVPASILKVFTSLVAIHHLGEAYRFPTTFYLDGKRNLEIKGYGDPLLISEVLDQIARRLADRLGEKRRLNDLVLDDSHFRQPLTIPGISSSRQPYDAPNGALNANFNTVFFKDGGDRPVSAEPQTPLIPFALERIRRSGIRSGRIVLSQVEQENTLYAGHLLRHFLERHGIRCAGRVRIGAAGAGAKHLLLAFRSPYTLLQITESMLAHSNNFIANQLLIAAGARALGPPGTLQKGIATAQDYAQSNLGTKALQIVEGSGISRRNRITADQMQRVLTRFEPYRKLMRRDEREYYKTGTLAGVSTRAGYLQDRSGSWYRYVVMCNSVGQTTGPVMDRLREYVAGL